MSFNISANQLTPAAHTGVWVEFMGARFKVASSKTPAFYAALTRRLRKIPQAAQKANPELMLEVTRKAQAETVLLDWEGVTDGPENTPVPCTLENKMALLEAPDFRDWLNEVAADNETFKAEATAADAEALKSVPDVDA